MRPIDADPDDRPSPAEVRRRVELYLADRRLTEADREVAERFLAGRPVDWPEDVPVPPRPTPTPAGRPPATLARLILAVDLERSTREKARPEGLVALQLAAAVDLARAVLGLDGGGVETPGRRIR